MCTKNRDLKCAFSFYSVNKYKNVLEMYQNQRVSGRFGCVLISLTFNKLLQSLECNYFSFEWSVIFFGFWMKVSFYLQLVFGVHLFVSSGLASSFNPYAYSESIFCKKIKPNFEQY